MFSCLQLQNRLSEAIKVAFNVKRAAQIVPPSVSLQSAVWSCVIRIRMREKWLFSVAQRSTTVVIGRRQWHIMAAVDPITAQRGMCAMFLSRADIPWGQPDTARVSMNTRRPDADWHPTVPCTARPISRSSTASATVVATVIRRSDVNKTPNRRTSIALRKRRRV